MFSLREKPRAGGGADREMLGFDCAAMVGIVLQSEESFECVGDGGAFEAAWLSLIDRQGRKFFHQTDCFD
jgi:hypothetical protein